MRYLSVFLTFIILILGCSNQEGLADELKEDLFCTNDDLSFEVLRVSSVEHEGKNYTYRLLKLRCGNKEPAYAQFFLPPSGTKSPCVMRTMPYALVTWTGEKSDQDYADSQAQLPNGLVPLDPDEQVRVASLHLLNGFGVLFVYGRFYQGDSILNDVNDMIAGLKYLEQESLADNSKIAITGFSWGGFEAVYGASYAPDSVKPLAGAAYFPVTDFKKWYEYSAYPEEYINSEDKINEWKFAISGYLQRIEAQTGGSSREPNADFSYFKHDDLSSRLDTNFIILHDSWDSLVPIVHSKEFYEANKDKISPLWFYHEGPIDYETAERTHADLLSIIDYNNPDVRYAVPAYQTMALIFLYSKLADPGQNFIVMYQSEAMERFISYVKEYRQSGYDMEWAAERLLDFFDERIIFYALEGLISKAGGEVITEVFNNAWGSDYSEAELEAVLCDGLP